MSHHHLPPHVQHSHHHHPLPLLPTGLRLMIEPRALHLARSVDRTLLFYAIWAASDHKKCSQLVLSFSFSFATLLLVLDHRVIPSLPVIQRGALQPPIAPQHHRHPSLTIQRDDRPPPLPRGAPIMITALPTQLTVKIMCTRLRSTPTPITTLHRSTRRIDTTGYHQHPSTWDLIIHNVSNNIRYQLHKKRATGINTHTGHDMVFDDIS